MLHHLFLTDLAPVFFQLVSLSLSASFIGLGILLIRRIADRKIPPRWKIALWSLMLLALLIPYRAPSRLAVIPQTPTFSVQMDEPQTPTAPSTAVRPNPPTEHSTAPSTAAPTTPRTPLRVKQILPFVWCIGMVAMLLYLLAGQAFLSYRLRKSMRRPYQNDALITNCHRTLHITRRIPIWTQDYLQTPAIAGLFAPNIYLPSYVNEMSEESIHYILLHEFSHYKRGDLWYNTLLRLLQIVYWFNPLLWVLFYFVRQDLEVCNDHAVLHALQPSAHTSYARSMLETLGRSNAIPPLPQFLYLADNKKNMKRRIQMIQLHEMFQKHRLPLALMSLAILAILAVLFLTKPAQGANPDTSAPQPAASSASIADSSSESNTTTPAPTNTPTPAATTTPTAPTGTLISFAEGTDDETYTIVDTYAIADNNCLDASFTISDASGNELQTITYSTYFNQAWYNTYLENGGKMVRFLDVDFDGNLDFVGQLYGAERDQYYSVWLYDTQTKQFAYSEEYSMQSNPVYNTQTQYYLSMTNHRNAPISYTLFAVQGGHLAYLGALEGVVNADNNISYTERMYGDLDESGTLYWREVQTSNEIETADDLSPLWDGFAIDLS